MGETLSTITSWINARCEQVTGWLKEAWKAVQSVFEGIMDAVRSILPMFSYRREREWMETEVIGAGGGTTKTRAEVGCDKLEIGREVNNQPSAPLKLSSEMSEKEKEKWRGRFRDARMTMDDVEEILLKPGQSDSRETEGRKLEELKKKPHFQNIAAFLAAQPVANEALG